MKVKDASVLNRELVEDAEAATEKENDTHHFLECSKQQSSRKISLITSDGVEIEVERRVAEKSNLIKDLIADFGGDVDEPIPIQNVNEPVMRKVIEWCEQDKHDDSVAAKDDTNAAPRKDSATVGEWDAEFVQVDQDMLFEIILAANYLDIKTLLDASCRAVANKLTGKTLEQICQTFSIDDYPVPKPDAPTASSTASETTDGPPPSHTYHPTPTDVYHARRILQHVPLRSGNIIPPELALLIVSLGYTPRLATRRAAARTYRANSFWRPGPHASVAGLYLSTPPIPHPDADLGIVKIIPRRVVFQTWAADQGWATFGGDGTFRNSHTWFEASILRPLQSGTENDGGGEGAVLEDVLADPWETPRHARRALVERGWDFVRGDGGSVVWKVCHNITAKAEYSEYRVEWERGVVADVKDDEGVGNGKGFLELLEPGCMVVLWARAEQQCWENSVESATIEIEYEVL